MRDTVVGNLVVSDRMVSCVNCMVKGLVNCVMSRLVNCVNCVVSGLVNCVHCVM